MADWSWCMKTTFIWCWQTSVFSSWKPAAGYLCWKLQCASRLVSTSSFPPPSSSTSKERFAVTGSCLKFQDISSTWLFSTVFHGLGLVRPGLHQSCFTDIHCLKINAAPTEQAFLLHQEVRLGCVTVSSYNLPPDNHCTWQQYGGAGSLIGMNNSVSHVRGNCRIGI